MNYLVFSNTLRLLGLLLMPFSVTMLPPIMVAVWYQENTVFRFLTSTLVTLLLGFLLWFPFRKHRREVQPREAFLIVTLLWIGLASTGAFPFLLSENPNIHYLDAFFETMSGLTTTGITVLSNLEKLPKSILYYRQQLQFIGGGGVIVLSLAILPLFNIGGTQLFRAEISGPFKEDRLTPRITETAKTLWLLYVGLTVLCAFAYWAGGMDVFNAIGYSFSTISTGGFGTHDQNFGYFNNSLLEMLCAFFMLLGATNFSLHFCTIRRKSLKQYWQDPECSLYFILWMVMVLLIVFTLGYFNCFDKYSLLLSKTIFQVSSFLSTTGYCSTHFEQWPTFVPFILLALCLIGGCAGSTAGGIKVIRLCILQKQGWREIQKLIHPNGHYLIKVGSNTVPQKTLDTVLGFFCIFAGIFGLLLFILLAMGLEPRTAFSALVASLSNTGLTLGNYPENFQTFSSASKLVICIAMLGGRLELLTLLVLLTPNYWRY